MAVEFDLGATVFRDEDFVSDFDGEFDEHALVVLTASAEAEDLSFLWLFLCSVWKDDAACADRIGFETFDEDALSEWFDIGQIIVCLVGFL